MTTSLQGRAGRGRTMGGEVEEGQDSRTRKKDLAITITRTKGRTGWNTQKCEPHHPYFQVRRPQHEQTVCAGARHPNEEVGTLSSLSRPEASNTRGAYLGTTTGKGARPQPGPSWGTEEAEACDQSRLYMVVVESAEPGVKTGAGRGQWRCQDEGICHRGTIPE
jgi:hypothetical protein